MFEYVLRIEGLVDRFPNTTIWRMYDEEFCQAKPQKPWLEWHELNQSVIDSVTEEHRAWAKHNCQESPNSILYENVCFTGQKVFIKMLSYKHSKRQAGYIGY